MLLEVAYYQFPIPSPSLSYLRGMEDLILTVLYYTARASSVQATNSACDVKHMLAHASCSSHHFLQLGAARLLSRLKHVVLNTYKPNLTPAYLDELLASLASSRA